MNPFETMSAETVQESYSDDIALVMAAKTGDEEAFSELIIRNRERILSVGRRITNNYADAEDVLQTTCLQAFVHICEFDCRAKFSTWMTRIAINSALMLLRKRRAANTGSLDDLLEIDPRQLRDTKVDVWADVLNRERAWQLEKAIDGLHPGLRTVMQIRAQHQGSIKQIAELTGLSVVAIKSRLFRARRELRRSLQAYF